MEKRENRKMERIRKPFQGVGNIVRFNWQFYILSISIVALLFILNKFTNTHYNIYINILCLLAIGGILISLLVSFYVYDLSNLYSLNWLIELNNDSGFTIININAGFDETSAIIHAKYPDSELHVFDFYNPSKHTEPSIKRARQAYTPYPSTKTINTNSLPLLDNYADTILIILSAHEIRDEKERVIFFKELNRVIKNSGHIIVTEHLRDIPNFLAYSIGCFHFFSRSSWNKTFNKAGFIIYNKVKITPFITTFILKKNGNLY